MAQVGPVQPENYHLPGIFYEEKGQGDVSSICAYMATIPLAVLVGAANAKKIYLSENNLEEGLEPLVDKTMVHIKKFPTKINGNSGFKYSVTASSGAKLFEIVGRMQTTRTAFLFGRSRCFTMTLINVYAEYVCELVGYRGPCGAFVSLQRGSSSSIGKVEECKTSCCCCCWSPTTYYKVRTDSHKAQWTVSRVNGETEKLNTNDKNGERAEFEVLSFRNLDCVATISQEIICTTKENCERSQPSEYTLTFPQSSALDRIEKALLVSVVIMMDLQMFRVDKASKSICHLVVGCILLVLMGFLIITGLFLLLAPSSRPPPESGGSLSRILLNKTAFPT